MTGLANAMRTMTPGTGRLTSKVEASQPGTGRACPKASLIAAVSASAGGRELHPSQSQQVQR